jgi:hypothetical protein
LFPFKLDKPEYTAMNEMWQGRRGRACSGRTRRGYWREGTGNHGSPEKVGGQCSTKVSQAAGAAGEQVQEEIVLGSGIDVHDTPLPPGNEARTENANPLEGAEARERLVERTVLARKRVHRLTLREPWLLGKATSNHTGDDERNTTG